MTALETLIKLIKTYEGCKLQAYWDDSGDCWTIGWGCTGEHINEDSEWTQEEADREMARRAGSALGAALKASPVLASESAGRQAAIADLIYNLGLYGYIGHSVKPYIDKKEWGLAAEEILLFCHSGGVVLQGLKDRRKSESNLILGG